MFVQAFTLAAFAGAAAAQSSLQINTPSGLTLCEPSLITWDGGAAPYIVSVIPGGQQSAAALKYLSQSTTDHSITWKIDIEAGTQVTLKVLDNTGLAAFSAPVTIQGTDRSCLEGGNTSASSSASEAPASQTSESQSETSASETSTSDAASSSEASSSEAASSEAASSEAASSAAAPSTSSAAAVPSSAAPSVAASSSSASAAESKSAAASTSATKSATPSPTASAHSGAMANVAPFGILAAAGALAALF